MQKETLVEVGLRDKFVEKILLIPTTFFCAFAILCLAFWTDRKDWQSVLLVFILILNLAAIVWCACHLLAPSVAIDGSNDGIYVHGLFKSEFFSFDEIEYASHKASNSRYARGEHAVAFLRNEKKDIGTVYITVKQEGVSRLRTLYRIANASFAVHWINDEKKKRTEAKK